MIIVITRSAYNEEIQVIARKSKGTNVILLLVKPNKVTSPIKSKGAQYFEYFFGVPLYTTIAIPNAAEIAAYTDRYVELENIIKYEHKRTCT